MSALCTKSVRFPPKEGLQDRNMTSWIFVLLSSVEIKTKKKKEACEGMTVYRCSNVITVLRIFYNIKHTYKLPVR